MKHLCLIAGHNPTLYPVEYLSAHYLRIGNLHGVDAVKTGSA
jgi:hypothetical protein